MSDCYDNNFEKKNQKNKESIDTTEKNMKYAKEKKKIVLLKHCY